MPFLKADSDDEAEIILARKGDRTFSLVEGFRYVGSETYPVRPEDLQETDLASVPWFFRWFVSSSGRHTPAALLHDHLVGNGLELDPGVERDAADDVFLEAMADLDVPFVRRWVMWAAVVIATRWTKPWLWARLGIALWLVVSIAGLVVFVTAVATWSWALLAAAALAPIPFAALWGRRFRAGVVAGYGVLMVWLPFVAVVLSYSMYWVTEQVARLLIRPTSPSKVEGPPGVSEL